MEFKIYDASGEMPRKGHQLLTIIKDNRPLLDLFVRESIQNSLDAAKVTSAKVRVRFELGEFDHAQLSKELIGLKDSFYQRYNGKYSYIAVRDYETTGLTGKMSRSELIGGEDPGNLLKLVYGCQETKEEDSLTGGSWGVGKTIFSKMGIGIVFYYSRIKLATGSYESRLVGALVEDERKKTAVCPNGKNDTPSGIAWWGVSCSNNGNSNVIPITDSNIIGNFLSILGLQPYGQDETGTTVIIPYFDAESKLNEARKKTEDFDDGANNYRLWLNDIMEYLNLSVNKWYYPRLNNKYFKHGPYLEVDIENSQDSIRVDFNQDLYCKPFSLMQALYNRVSYRNDMPQGYTDFLLERNIIYQIIPIRLGKGGALETGLLSFAKVSQGEFKSSTDAALLFELVGNCFSAYTRSPGMIVNYRSEELKAIENEGEYVFSQFVLSSTAKLPEDGKLLEVAIKSAEGPSHKSWEDNSYGKKIPEQVKKKLIDAYSEKQETKNEGYDIIGRKLVGVLTPTHTKKPKTKDPMTKTKFFSYKITGIAYNPFSISYQLRLFPMFSSANILLGVAADGVTKSIVEWIKSGITKEPFCINNVELRFNGSSLLTIDEENLDAEEENHNIELLWSDEGVPYGVNIVRKGKCEKDVLVDMRLTIDVFDQSMRPEISFEFGTNTPKVATDSSDE